LTKERLLGDCSSFNREQSPNAVVYEVWTVMKPRNAARRAATLRIMEIIFVLSLGTMPSILTPSRRQDADEVRRDDSVKGRPMHETLGECDRQDAAQKGEYGSGVEGDDQHSWHSFPLGTKQGEVMV
jgi:hypothetical protein